MSDWLLETAALDQDNWRPAAEVTRSADAPTPCKAVRVWVDANPRGLGAALVVEGGLQVRVTRDGSDLEVTYTVWRARSGRVVIEPSAAVFAPKGQDMVPASKTANRSASESNPVQSSYGTVPQV